jgi:hypothetical protein
MKAKEFLPVNDVYFYCLSSQALRGKVMLPLRCLRISSMSIWIFKTFVRCCPASDWISIRMFFDVSATCLSHLSSRLESDGAFLMHLNPFHVSQTLVEIRRRVQEDNNFMPTISAIFRGT